MIVASAPSLLHDAGLDRHPTQSADNTTPGPANHHEDSPHRRIAASPHRRIAASPHRRNLLTSILLTAAISAPAYAVTVDHETVQPADTCSGIPAVLGAGGQHYVAAPVSTSDRRNVLVVFLGGAQSAPGAYNDISDYAASLQYGVINLAYPNNSLIANNCLNNNECYRQYRGEVAFGKDVVYAPGIPSYSSSAVNVDKDASIINRLVCTIDFLANESRSPDPLPGRSYWLNFLVQDASSPYVTPTLGHVYPAWDKIILAGHSQGAGYAAFIAKFIPSSTPARRVVMFSGTQDNYNAGGVDNSPSWVTDPSNTSMSKFWGLRNANEGVYGDFVETNWMNMGGSGGTSVGVGNEDSLGSQPVGTGTSVPTTLRHRLVTSEPSGNLTRLSNHNSTAVDGETILPDIKKSWEYLLTGFYAD